MNPEVIADTDRLTQRVVPLPMATGAATEPDGQFYRPPMDQGVAPVAANLSIPWLPIRVPGTNLIGIGPFGYVLRCDGTALQTTITGQLASTAPSSTDPNAFICPAIGSIVYLKINTNFGGFGGLDPSLSGGCDIKHGSAWTGHPIPSIYVTSGGELVQSAFCVKLASIDSPSSDRAGVFTVDFGGGDVRKVVQWFNRNIVTRIRNDNTALVIEPADPALIYYDAP